MRSYQDGGEHYAGQLGDEPTPAEFVDALIECTKEMMRVTKPSGSIWVNLGDKYSQRTQVRRSSHQPGFFPGKFEEMGQTWAERARAGAVRMPHQNIIAADGTYVPEKSLMGIPWRYAIRCIDELGLILRAEVIWAKPSGMPDPTNDRVRRSHETWFHFVQQKAYFANLDPVLEATVDGKTKPPASVQTVAIEPLSVPKGVGAGHYAAFPTAWPRWIIQGWSPENGVILDPFGGTGTTALVASVLGRTGISNDMSSDYTRIAQWRTTDPKQRAKAAGLKYKAPPKMRAEKPLFETEEEDSCRG